ncbi:MAG: divergent polysaccharide deacetylase family protein [Rhodospirillales bacterium]
MKLPKLPKIPKLPKLPKLAKLPGLSAIPNPFKKKGDDDEYEDDLDDVAIAAPPAKEEEEGEDIPVALPPRPPADAAPPESSAPDAAPPESGAPDAEAPESGAPDAAPPESGAPDAEVPDFGDDFDDEDEEDADQGRRKQLIIAAAGVAVVALGVIGGASWWFLGGSDEDPAAAAAQGRGGDKGPRVAMAVPAKPGTPNALLTTPPANSGPIRVTTRPPDGPRPATPGPAAEAGESALARAAGDIGGRFGGRADPLGGSLNTIGGALQEKGTGIVIPAITSSTLRTLPDHPGGRPLGATPDARLVEKKDGVAGTLPIIGKDGDEPWRVYARNHDAEVDDDTPRVAIVILGLGMSRAATRAAISKLPPQVTLALDPYANDLSDWLVRARLVGHEVMVMLPMESERFPVHDAGPFSLDTGLKTDDNIARLENVLSRFSGYIGVVPVMGSRFGTSETMMRPILEALKARGLMLLIAGNQTELAAPKIAAKLGLPRAIGDVVLDEEPSRAAIDAKLARLDEIIEVQSRAVAVAHPYPATIARLIDWIKKLEGRKIALLPVSALADTSIAKPE